jgi:hypothetical protein
MQQAAIWLISRYIILANARNLEYSGQKGFVFAFDEYQVEARMESYLWKLFPPESTAARKN